MTRVFYAALSLFVLHGAVLFPVAARAAENAEVAIPQANSCQDCWKNLKHVLNQHAFLPTFLIQSPFANSNATLILGMGVGTLSDPGVSGGELELGAFTPRFAGAISILPSLALTFGVNGNTIVGLNSPTVARYGASTGYSYKLGAIYELLRSNAQVLSVALDVANAHRLAISPLEAANEGVEALLGEGDSDFVSDSTELSWRPSLRYVRALSPIFGFRGNLEFRFNSGKEGVENSANQSRLGLGVGFDADLKPWINFPIGFLVNYLRGQGLSSGGSNSNTVSFGVYETISPLVNVGLEVGRVLKSDVDHTIAALVFRSYFN